MSSPISGLSSAVSALNLTSLRMERAASTVASAGLPTSSAAPSIPVSSTPAPAPVSSDLVGAEIDVMMAQRAFSAELRVVEAQARMTRALEERPKGGQLA